MFKDLIIFLIFGYFLIGIVNAIGYYRVYTVYLEPEKSKFKELLFFFQISFLIYDFFTDYFLKILFWPFGPQFFIFCFASKEAIKLFVKHMKKK